MTAPSVYICKTCEEKHGAAWPMSFSEAMIHADANGHKVVIADEELTEGVKL